MEADQIADALQMARDRVGVCHNVEEGPNARWVHVADDFGYFEEDDVCTKTCPACELARTLDAAIALGRKEPSDG